MGIAARKMDSGNTGVGITVQSNENAECLNCGAQQGNYQYCINCGHDSLAESGAQTASSRPITDDYTADDAVAVDSSEAQTQTVINVFSTPGAKDLAEQLAALVTAQSRPAKSAQTSDLAVAVRPSRLSSALPTHPGSGPSQLDAQAGNRVTRSNMAALLVAGLLALTLAGVALGRAVQDQPEDFVPSTGALVSAEDKSAQGDANPERVVCWDGSTGKALSECGTPEGLRGLAWVFPSIQPEDCVATGSVGRPQAWSCPVDAGGPNEASIVYGELFSVEDGLNHYSRLYENGIGIQKTVGDRYVWKAKRSNVRAVWQRSSMYVDQPWSVHIESATKLGAKLAYRSVEFRSPDQLAGLAPTD